VFHGVVLLRPGTPARDRTLECEATLPATTTAVKSSLPPSAEQAFGQVLHCGVDSSSSSAVDSVDAPIHPARRRRSHVSWSRGRIRKAPRRYGLWKMRSNYSTKVMVGIVSRSLAEMNYGRWADLMD